jgi:rubrerythrin
MEISSVFFILAVLVIVGMYLYAPFTSRAMRLHAGESQEASGLRAELDRVIDSLRELDFDHSLGKVPAEDYPSQRAAILQKGADVMRRLDEIEAIPLRHDAESRIEKAAAASTDGAEDEGIESMIAARRKEHKGRSAGFCPRCGKPVLVSDKFCPACGKSLV